MNKLTQQEASDLIQKAWQEVSIYNLGSWRFSCCVWGGLMDRCTMLIRYASKEEFQEFYETCLKHKDDIAFEPNSDIATEKFYKYFVEGQLSEDKN